MQIEQKRLAYLTSRIQVYLDDPSKRAVVEGYPCKYRTKDGRKCFIGQDIPDELYTSDMEGNTPITIAENFNLPMKEFGGDFLQDCQRLHDQSDFWDEFGLTNKGHYYFLFILKTWCSPL